MGNLLQERNLIRSTRQEYKDVDPNVPQITFTLCGVLLEGALYRMILILLQVALVLVILVRVAL
jgi:hypothetical protein